MNIHPRTLQLLAKVGLEPIELDALAMSLPHGIPLEPRGFGLLGPTGTMKTSTLVHAMAALVDRMVRRQPDPNQAKLIWIGADGVGHDARLFWVYWPKAAAELRLRKWERVWIEDWTATAEEVPFLVLDDLGREQRDGQNDAAQEVLQRVLDTRHRRKLPLWWTSNRTREELGSFYGGPFMSRLLGTWPDYPLDGQDRRLFPVDEFKKAAGGEA